MKSLLVCLGFLVIGVFLSLQATGEEINGKTLKCVTLEEGTLYSFNGQPVSADCDQFGCNYHTRIYDGRYCDVDQKPGGEFCHVDLFVKWNNAWLSNKDCDGDNFLDKPQSYIGSGARCINRLSGTYLDENGNKCRWIYLLKIEAVPLGATLVDGIWYTADGREIGPEIWGSFAKVVSIYNNPNGGKNGIEYLKPVAPGFGHFK